jgi:hypothetical protein
VACFNRASGLWRNKPLYGFLGRHLVGKGGLIPQRTQKVKTLVRTADQAQTAQLLQGILGRTKPRVRFQSALVVFSRFFVVAKITHHNPPEKV